VSYLAGHLSPAIAASRQAGRALQAAAALHGYTTALWWTAGIFAADGIVCGSLLRRGPLAGQAQAVAPHTSTGTLSRLTRVKAAL
jgi:hypothetical protein